MPASPSIHHEIAPRQITVGDPIELTLTVDVPEGKRAILPSAESFAPTEVLKTDTIQATPDRIAIRYTLTLFEPGRQELPDLPVVLTSEAGADTLFVKLGQAEVRSVLDPADSLAEIKDIKPPVSLAWTLRELMPFIIGGLILILLGAGGYLLYRRHRRQSGEIAVWTPPPLPPYEIAIRRLEELKAKKLWQNGYLKEYYSELTEIVKEYIEKQFGFVALEMTTSELLSARERWASGGDGYDFVRDILTGGDLVKFAKFKPSPHENENALKSGYSFLDLSRVATAEPEGGS